MALILVCSTSTSVLSPRRRSSSDEQLYKDIEGVLEGCCDMVRTSSPSQPRALSDLFGFWDGVCCYMEGMLKPGHWVDQLMRAAKACSADTRQSAASETQVMPECNMLHKSVKCNFAQDCLHD